MHGMREEGRVEEFQILPIDQIVESKTNPRRTFRGMEELVASVRQHGVLVPLLVRPVPISSGEKIGRALGIDPDVTAANGHYEIVAGARRFRAAREAGLAEIPVRVKDLGDGEALELQIVENLCREDVHPLEEALGYEVLLERPGYDVAAIAAKVVRSESYIYQRLKLLDLIEPARDKFLEDVITAGHAVLIARLQPREQKQALEEAIDRTRIVNGKPIVCGVRELAAFIQTRIHLDLKKAIFKKDDAELVHKAGPCTTCHKRTGFTPQLFPDIAQKDTCTDPACWEVKTSACIAREIEVAKKRGEQLLQISTEYGSYGSKPKASEPPKANKWVEVKKDRGCATARKAIVVEGNDRRGQTLQVCADKSCKRHWGGGYKHTGRDPKDIARERKQKEALTREIELRRRIFEAVLAAAPERLSREDLDLVAIALANEMQGNGHQAVVQRHGWEPGKRRWGGQNWHSIINREAPKLNDADLQKLLIEMSLQRELEVYSWGPSVPPAQLLATAERYGIDDAAISASLDVEIREKKAKQDARKKKAAPQKSAKPKRAAKATAPEKPPAPAVVCERCGHDEAFIDEAGWFWSEKYLVDSRYVCTGCESLEKQKGRKGKKSQ